MKPYDFQLTRFYESNADFTFSGIQLDLAEYELIICSTIIDCDNYSILTTRRLFTKQDGQLSIENIQGATDKFYGDFKGYKDRKVTFGEVLLANGKQLKYFIETGKASMVMIHGVRTLIGTTKLINN